RVVADDRAWWPGRTPECGAAHDVAAVGGELGEDAEFGRCQRHGLVWADDAVGRWVEPQGAALGGWGCRRAAAQQRLDSHDQFGDRKPLGHVVIAAGVKSAQT